MKVIMNSNIGNGTCLQGYLEARYSKFVEVFGKPNCLGDNYKTDAEWAGTIDGQEFTIYNYKDGKNYCGDEGLDVEDITEWHIGGRSKQTADKLNVYFERQQKIVRAK